MKSSAVSDMVVPETLHNIGRNALYTATRGVATQEVTSSGVSFTGVGKLL